MPGPGAPCRERRGEPPLRARDLCRREGIKPGAFYAWTKEFMEAGKERLSFGRTHSTPLATTLAMSTCSED